jgi:hypothetical protein
MIEAGVLDVSGTPSFMKTEKRMLKVQTYLTLCFGRLLKRERLLWARVMELETI